MVEVSAVLISVKLKLEMAPTRSPALSMPALRVPTGDRTVHLSQVYYFRYVFSLDQESNLLSGDLPFCKFLF